MDASVVSCSFLTFNLFSDLPAFRHLDRRLEIAARAIAAERPGIVALQEIVRSPICGDMGRKLCDLVNRHCTAPSIICIMRLPTGWAKANGSTTKASR